MTVVYNRYGSEHSNMTVVYNSCWVNILIWLLFKTDGGKQSNMTVVYNRYGDEHSNMTVVYNRFWGEHSNMTIV